MRRVEPVRYTQDSRLISLDWISQDAWWRRDCGQDSFLTVSRTESGTWHWRWSEYVPQLRTGRLIAESTAGCNSAAEAREWADLVVSGRTVGEVAA